MIWNSKEALANFIGAKEEDLVFCPNATIAASTILNSLTFEEGDELVTTNHGYGACVNALKWYGEKQKANVIIAEVPFPISSPEEVIESILSKVSSRTKLVMIDYISSPTGLLFPVKKIVDALAEKGIDCFVDGAHVPGQVPLNVDQLNATYFIGNCHKWICSPKGSGFLHVRKDRQHLIHPLTVSHKYDKPRKSDQMWSSNFFWPGTADYTGYLCVKDAIEFMGSLFSGGWDELMKQNRERCLSARKIVSEKIGIPLPAPEEMIVNLSSFDLGETEFPASNFNYISPLWEKLWSEYKIELPVLPWNRNRPRLLLRFSSQCYNSIEQYEYLGEVLANEIKKV
jgi:isopenicillin-N epimerase